MILNRKIRATTSKLSITCALIVGVSTANTAFAQDNAATDEQSAASSANSGVADIIVTARKRAENVQDVPVAISAFTGEDLQTRGVVTPADFVRIAPGVNIASNLRSATGLNFVIRGLGPADVLLSTDPSAAVYVNEIYVPRTYGLKLGLFDLERTEILKGPQGTLYGRNSTGGAVGIFTRKPDLTAVSGFASLEGGQYATIIGQGAVSVPIVKDVLAARIAFNIGSTDGYVKGANDENIGKRKDFALRGSVRYEPNDRVSFNVVVAHTRTSGAHTYWNLAEVLPGVQTADIEAGLELGQPSATAGAIGDAYLNAAFASQGRYRNQDTQGIGETFHGTRGSFIAAWEASDALTIKATTGFDKFRRTQTTDLDVTPLRIAQSSLDTKDRFISQELQASGALFNERVRYVLGGYYSDEKGTEFAGTVSVPSLTGGRNQIYDVDVHNQSLGAYFQSDIKVIDRLTLTGGVRYTEDKRGAVFRTRNEFPAAATQCRILPSLLDVAGICMATMPDLKFHKVSYTASVSYAVTDDVNLYATARSGFRSGGYNIFTDLLTGVSSFRPDSVKDAELGIKSQLFDNKLRINIAAFQSKFTDIQKATLTFTSTGASLRTLANAAAATIKGVEMDLAARPFKNFDLDATVAHTDAAYDSFISRNAAGVILEDRTSEPFEAPRWTYGIGAGYRFDLPKGELFARIDWYWRSKSIFTTSSQLLPTETILTQASYGLLSGRLEWRLPDSGFSIALLGRNLLNKRYDAGGVDLRALGFSAKLPGEPRYVGVQVRKTWGGG